MKEFIRKNKSTEKYYFLHLLYPLYWSITYNDTYTDFVHYINRIQLMSIDKLVTFDYTFLIWYICYDIVDTQK